MAVGLKPDLRKPPLWFRLVRFRASGALDVQLRNAGHAGCTFIFQANAYEKALPVRRFVRPHQESFLRWPIQSSGCWYDLSLQVPELPGFSRRFAGRMETGLASISDPAPGSH